MLKDNIAFPDFVKLDLRIGTIKTAAMVVGSDRLIKLEVDLGEEIGTRQIIAGIGKHYKAEELVGRQVVVVVNLESKKMMNLESSGMILAAGDEEIALLTLDKKLPNGSLVR